MIDVDRLMDAPSYGREGYPHDLWTEMRRQFPVHWCEPAAYRPFWAVTRYADVKWVSTRPDLFASSPRTLLLNKSIEARGISDGIRTIVHMDPPEHRAYRAIGAPFFQPGGIRPLEDRIRTVTRTLLEQVSAAKGDEAFDFVQDFAAQLPLQIICNMLGADEADHELVLRIANTAFGLEDPEFGPQMAGLFPEMAAYYQRTAADRQACPVDDIYSAIANAEVGGCPIGAAELFSYYIILTTAGHDTTRNAITGGLHALIEHPEQLDLLRRRPELAATAAEEILRWTSPVVQFCRTATADTEIAGQPIRAGDDVAIFYPSANRDETVFEAPFEFRVDRHPNPQIAFGFGEHYCLGVHLARLEIRVFLEEVVPRLASVALAGPVQRTAATTVTGIKHLPVRWTLGA
jgi:cytochrome P450